MSFFGNLFTKPIRLTIPAFIFLTSSTTVIAANAFLDRFSVVDLVASTVPANGDTNPYGVAIVQHSTGMLVRGNILVSNFNDTSNQGKGTTIVQVSPEGSVTQFAQIE